MELKKKAGFTLLEIIIVIVILGVIAGLAIPRLTGNIELSRAQEALDTLNTVRQSVERCGALNSNNYTGCAIANLDIGDQSNNPGAHFNYTMFGTTTATGYNLRATRKTTIDAGSLPAACVGGTGTPCSVNLVYTNGVVTRSGSDIYGSIR